MSDELLEIVDNIKQPSAWVRILLMILFAFASYILLLPLIIIISITQALFVLIAGESNANLKYFAATLELYTSQIIKFLTYLSEERPFPFSDFPELEDDSLDLEVAAAKKANGSADGLSEDKSATAKKSAAKKKAPAKKATKKKSVKKSVKSDESEKADKGGNSNDS